MIHGELNIDTSTLPWLPFSEGIELKLLGSSAESGRWTIMLKCEEGSHFAKHKHYGAGEYFVLKGRMEYGDEVAVTGHYGYEPLGAVHNMTTFTQYTEMVFTNHGPIAFLNDEDTTLFILDNAYLEELAQTAQLH